MSRFHRYNTNSRNENEEMNEEVENDQTEEKV